MIFFRSFRWSISSFAIGLLAGALVVPSMRTLQYAIQAISTGQYSDLTLPWRALLVSKPFTFGRFSAVEMDQGSQSAILALHTQNQKWPAIAIRRNKISNRITECVIATGRGESLGVIFKDTNEMSDLIIERTIDQYKLVAFDHQLLGVYDLKLYGDKDGDKISAIVDGQTYWGAMFNGHSTIQKDGKTYRVKSDTGVLQLVKIK